MTRPPRALPPAAIAGAVLVLVALFGGAVAVAGHVNTAADAFGNRAELATPWPVLLAQALATAAVVRWRDWRAIAGAILLAVSGLLALASIGDDETFRAGLPGWVQTGQGVLIGLSAVAVVPCALHVRRLVRDGGGDRYGRKA